MTLSRPVPLRTFLAEFRALYDRSSIRGRVTVTIDERMARVHRADPRRFAEVDVARRHFYFAPQILSLPRRHREALIAHELGHVVRGPGPHSEADADRAALASTGVRIGYDRRWPGKGLQVRVNPAPYQSLDRESFDKFAADVGAIRPGGKWTKADEGRLNMALVVAEDMARAQGKSLFSGGNAFGAESRGATEAVMEGDPGWCRVALQGLYAMVVRSAGVFDREGRVAYEKRVNPILKLAARLRWFVR